LDKYERFKVAEALKQQTCVTFLPPAFMFFSLFLFPIAHTQTITCSVTLINTRRFKAGEVVLQEGESGNAFYIVKSG